jgi:hypothetical protein
MVFRLDANMIFDYYNDLSHVVYVPPKGGKKIQNYICILSNRLTTYINSYVYTRLTMTDSPYESVYQYTFIFLGICRFKFIIRAT